MPGSVILSHKLCAEVGMGGIFSGVGTPAPVTLSWKWATAMGESQYWGFPRSAPLGQPLPSPCLPGGQKGILV